MNHFTGLHDEIETDLTNLHETLYEQFDNLLTLGNVFVDGNLGTKGSRTTWEDLFTNAYLNPVLSVSIDSLGLDVMCRRVHILYANMNICSIQFS